MSNNQFNAGDPLETPEGLYREPPSMLRLIQYKRCACETVNEVHCSITIKVSCQAVIVVTN